MSDAPSQTAYDLAAHLILTLGRAIHRHGILGHGDFQNNGMTVPDPPHWNWRSVDGTLCRGSLRFKSKHIHHEIGAMGVIDSACRPILVQAQAIADVGTHVVCISGSATIAEADRVRQLTIVPQDFNVPAELAVATTLGAWHHDALEALAEEIATWLATAPFAEEGVVHGRS